MNSIGETNHVAEVNTVKNKTDLEEINLGGNHTQFNEQAHIEKRHVIFKTNKYDELFVEIQNQNQEVIRKIPTDESNTLFKGSLDYINSQGGVIINKKS